MARSDSRFTATLGGLVVALLSELPTGCSFTGLGNYDVPTCHDPLGQTADVEQVGSVSGTPQISFTNGIGALASFLGSTPPCVQVADPRAPTAMGACLLGDSIVPQQPYAVPIGTNYAAVAVATSPNGTLCPSGLLAIGTDATNGTAGYGPACGAGTALPALVPAADGSSAWVGWYATPVLTRSDPIQGCTAAKAAPLLVTLGSSVNGETPSLGSTPVTLTTTALSVRPPAMAIAGGSTVLVASPDGDAASVWEIDGTTPPDPASAVTVSALKGAVAVSVGSDGGEAIAVVAEIGCSPQSIALSLGTLTGGFGAATTVAPAGTGLQVEPTVAWVAAEGYWVVSWLSNAGGTHAVARRFDTHGEPVAEVVSSNVSLLAATVTSSGTLYGYAQPAGGEVDFESVGLGCALGPGGSESAQ